jgi:CDP-diacylglycerol--glycerol-3-phosphate 3-phosphatidyltransferase
MGIYTIKPRFQKVLLPVRDVCMVNGVTPTQLNIAGLCFSFLLALSIFKATTQPLWLFGIPFLALLRTACNALDGMLARETQVASIKGELQNEFFDRCSDVAIFSAFLFVPGISELLVLAVVTLLLLSSFLGVLGKCLIGVRLYDGIMGKADRMLYLGITGVVQFFVRDWRVWNICLLVLFVGLLQTVFVRYRRIYTNK